MKKEINIEVEVDIDYMLIEEAIIELEKYKGLNAKIDYDDNNNLFILNVIYKREESDEEYDKRKQLEYKVQKGRELIEKTKEDSERAKYEELKKKFG